MRTDRYTKVILTIIAVALCVIALPRLETSEVEAASGRPEAVAAVGSQQAGQDVSPIPPTAGAESREVATSTKPLRWRVSNAFHDVDSDHSICGTVVSVRNVAAASVPVDVEWFDFNGNSIALSTLTIPSGDMNVFWTNANVQLEPFTASGIASNTVDFQGGWANVNANDPRILASAAIVCRDVAGQDASNLEAMVNVPTFPVGATAEFFTAGMPDTWTPAPAVSEVPE